MVYFPLDWMLPMRVAAEDWVECRGEVWGGVWVEYWEAVSLGMRVMEPKRSDV